MEGDAVDENRRAEQGSDDAFVLDHVVWESLTGPHARFATMKNQVARYPGDVAPFVALAPHSDESVWDDLATLFGPGGVVVLVAVELPPPSTWTVLNKNDAVQMTCADFQGQLDPEIVRLGSTDVPEMLALVEPGKLSPLLAVRPKIEPGTN